MEDESDYTQAQLINSEAKADHSVQDFLDGEMDGMCHTHQGDITCDTNEGDIDTNQDDITCDADEGDTDTDQTDTTCDADEDDTDTDQADITCDADEGDIDTDQADTDDMTYEMEEADTLIDSALYDDVCNKKENVESVINIDKTQCLYSGSSITNHDFSVALLSISHKHSLTNSSIVDVLNLFSQALPAGLPNQLPKSHHMLMKNFVNYNESIIVHRCCGYCSRLLSSNSSCEIPECRMAHAAESSFIQVLISKQLQTLFSGKDNIRT